MSATPKPSPSARSSSSANSRNDTPPQHTISDPMLYPDSLLNHHETFALKVGSYRDSPTESSRTSYAPTTISTSTIRPLQTKNTTTTQTGDSVMTPTNSSGTATELFDSFVNPAVISNLAQLSLPTSDVEPHQWSTSWGSDAGLSIPSFDIGTDDSGSYGTELDDWLSSFFTQAETTDALSYGAVLDSPSRYTILPVTSFTTFNHSSDEFPPSSRPSTAILTDNDSADSSRTAPSSSNTATLCVELPSALPVPAATPVLSGNSVQHQIHTGATTSPRTHVPTQGPEVYDHVATPPPTSPTLTYHNSYTRTLALLYLEKIKMSRHTADLEVIRFQKKVLELMERVSVELTTLMESTPEDIVHRAIGTQISSSGNGTVMGVVDAINAVGDQLTGITSSPSALLGVNEPRRKTPMGTNTPSATSKSPSVALSGHSSEEPIDLTAPTPPAADMPSPRSIEGMPHGIPQTRSASQNGAVVSNSVTPTIPLVSSVGNNGALQMRGVAGLCTPFQTPKARGREETETIKTPQSEPRHTSNNRAGGSFSIDSQTATPTPASTSHMASNLRRSTSGSATPIIPRPALPQPTILTGKWSPEEEHLLCILRDLAPMKGSEKDWEWVSKHFGPTRSHHQITIQATSLGLKESTTSKNRLLQQKRHRDQRSETPANISAAAGSKQLVSSISVSVSEVTNSSKPDSDESLASPFVKRAKTTTSTPSNKRAKSNKDHKRTDVDQAPTATVNTAATPTSLQYNANPNDTGLSKTKQVEVKCDPAEPIRSRQHPSKLAFAPYSRPTPAFPSQTPSPYPVPSPAMRYGRAITPLTGYPTYFPYQYQPGYIPQPALRGHFGPLPFEPRLQSRRVIDGVLQSQEMLRRQAEMTIGSSIEPGTNSGQ
ncbi:hypothetical protein CI109_104692 [Kwoniella shandongensis]|uniref:Uncharacterized protein n=1 Tax=Kwoniella shandongensis TaxID=1734106 RepID=A0A5M6BZM1_9TREE|nr:uncharacterized protein CI109_004855 [Kwoniella shandongensis]KAA5526855.1 hypothetical protein CI109_004855 [Kwoniella shandongensis]